MSIEFHCDHCGKIIRAPDEAGGRRGKCPYCHQSVYIKTPSDQIEDIPLAPIDESAEEAEARAQRESDRLAQSLLRERENDDAGSGRNAATSRDAGAGPEPAPTASAREIEGLVIDYLRAMASSELEQAERIADQLRPHRAAAQEIMERISHDSVPPPGLDHLPAAVLGGFLNSLRTDLQR